MDPVESITNLLLLSSWIANELSLAMLTILYVLPVLVSCRVMVASPALALCSSKSADDVPTTPTLAALAVPLLRVEALTERLAVWSVDAISMALALADAPTVRL